MSKSTLIGYEHPWQIPSSCKSPSLEISFFLVFSRKIKEIMVLGEVNQLENFDKPYQKTVK